MDEDEESLSCWVVSNKGDVMVRNGVTPLCPQVVGNIYSGATLFVLIFARTNLRSLTTEFGTNFRVISPGIHGIISMAPKL